MRLYLVTVLPNEITEGNLKTKHEFFYTLQTLNLVALFRMT